MADEALSKQTLRYGSAPSQAGDLYLPKQAHPAVVCLLHRGFWHLPYDREEMTPVARDLVARGYAVWNLEYRRVGESGAGWPGTLQDVAAGIEQLATLAAEGIDIDLDRVVVVGHSAGGHLALCAAAGGRAYGDTDISPRVKLSAVAGLAPLTDVMHAYTLADGREPVTAFMGGSPDDYPGRYAVVSPLSLVPLQVPQLIIHGTADRSVSINSARRYVTAARAAGDEVEFEEIEGMGHLEFCDPNSQAHEVLWRWLARRLQA